MTKKTIELSDDEIIVLGHFLSHFNEGYNKYTDKTEDIFESRAEKLILYTLENLLEPLSNKIFSEDYDKHLKDARQHILSRYDEKEI